MTNISNTTPHAINVIGENNITFEPSGILIRLTTKIEVVGEINGIPLSKTVFGEPIGLPEFQDGTYYIVSQLVKSALPNRSDLLVPAEMVRDEKGQILGCKSLGL